MKIRQITVQTMRKGLAINYQVVVHEDASLVQEMNCLEVNSMRNNNQDNPFIQ